MSKTCPICGKQSRVYMGNARKDGLCGYHADLLKEGKIILANGVYVYSDSKKPVIGVAIAKTEKETSNSVCLLCGKPSNGKPLCYDDYQQAKDASIDFVKGHNNADDLISYYRRLKNNMYQMFGDKVIRENCIKLVAIAMALETGFNYHVYIDTVYDDVRNILAAQKKKTSKPIRTNPNVAKKMDEAGSQVVYSLDHHLLDSQAEADIDNILFDLQKDGPLLSSQKAPYHIPHVDVQDITERGVNADWYIGVPAHPLAGFYIEYWGMKSNDEYEKNKKEKIELYSKHNIPVLGIEADEVRQKNALTSKIKEYLIKRVNGEN